MTGRMNCLWAYFVSSSIVEPMNRQKRAQELSFALLSWPSWLIVPDPGLSGWGEKNHPNPGIMRGPGALRPKPPPNRPPPGALRPKPPNRRPPGGAPGIPWPLPGPCAPPSGLPNGPPNIAIYIPSFRNMVHILYHKIPFFSINGCCGF